MSVNFETGLARPGELLGADADRVLESRESVLRGDRSWTRARFVVDAALMVAAAVVTDVGSSYVTTSTARVLWPALFGAIVLYLSYARGSYGRRIKLDTLDDLRAAGSVLAIATSVIVTLRVLSENGPDTAATHTVRLGVLAAVLIGCGRTLLNLCQSQARQHGRSLVPTLIVGAGHIGRTTAKRLLEHPELGFKPIGFLDKEPLEVNGSMRLPVLGASWDMNRVVAEHGIQQVIITFSTAPSEVLLRIANRCEQLGVGVAFVPRLFEKMTERLTIEHIGGLPLIAARQPNPRGWQFAVKYAVDRVVALLIILLLSPVLIGCALAVLLTMGRPIFFKQRRVGLDGQEFDMLKFRSMTGSPKQSGEADAAWFAQQLNLETTDLPVESDSEQRITLVGAVLRKTWLDELPQLFNVLRGDMSLVGPRPERTSYVRQAETQIYRYGDRLRVKAGITGWAQVNGLHGETSLSDRVEWDNYYIENASLWLDVKIIGWTMLSLFRPSAHRR